jgi:hypothetical protein
VYILTYPRAFSAPAVLFSFATAHLDLQGPVFNCNKKTQISTSYEKFFEKKLSKNVCSCLFLSVK